MPILMSAALMSMAALSAADEKAAMTAAGFAFNGKEWRQCARPGAGYQPAMTWIVDDLNRDGRFDAIIVERSTACYGGSGAGYWVVSKQADGSWRVLSKGNGLPNVLDTRGVGNWPDLEIGGPGACHPVQRWNGKAYVLNRRANQGKACR